MNPINQSDSNSERFLDEVLERIRKQPIPDRPELELGQLTTSASNKKKDSVLNTWRVPMLAIASSVSITAIVVLTISPTPTAFAQVQDAIKKTNTIQYRVIDEHFKTPGYPPRKKLVTDVTTKEPYWSRSTDLNGVHITDWKERMSLHLHDKNKIAKMQELAPTLATSGRKSQIREMFRDIAGHATERLGKTVYEGEPAEEFRVKLGTGGREFLVIVDTKTKLPITMIYEKHDGDGELMFRESFVDFVFDAELDDSLFTLAIPDGFEVETTLIGPKPPADEILVLCPGIGLVDFPFGTSKDTVLEKFGEPTDSSRRVYSQRAPIPINNPGEAENNQQDEIGPKDMAIYEEMYFNNYGLILRFHNGNVMGVTCNGQASTGASVRDFNGQTTKGIKIGSSIVEVLEVYGVPEWQDDEQLNYVRAGFRLNLSEQRVASMNFGKPIDERIEITVHKNGAIEQRVRQEKQ